MPGGQAASKKTFTGCFVSLLAFLILFFYSGLQYQRLVRFEEPQIMTSTRDSYFSTDYEFTTEDGLMIAFGLTSYDGNPEPIDDPTYGTLNAYYKSWGLKKDVPGIDFELLPKRKCTRSQLGLPRIDDETDPLSDYE